MSYNNIVFVDAGVSDYQTLVNGVEPGTEVVVLDGNSNGINQITEVLANRSDIDSVQIVSHGDEGSLQLGNSYLDSGNIASYEGQLQKWGKALAENGDILLYGCHVADGELGSAFINRLSELTEADIAASEDLTGNSDLGGDWILEAATGFIDAPLAFQVEAMSAFNSVLEPIKVTTNADSENPNDGQLSLREAIIEAENRNNNTIDIIDLSAIANQTINLTSSLPTITEQLEIQGNNVTINGREDTTTTVFIPFLGSRTFPITNFHQLFAIDGETPSTQIIFSDLTLRDGLAQGGDGNNGGGGGLGAGGALFINQGQVIADDVTFSDNRAVGGNSTGNAGIGGVKKGADGTGGGGGGRLNANNPNSNEFSSGGAGGAGGAGGDFFNFGDGYNGGNGGGGSFGSGGGSGGGGGAAGSSVTPFDVPSGGAGGAGGTGGFGAGAGGGGGGGFGGAGGDLSGSGGAGGSFAGSGQRGDKGNNIPAIGGTGGGGAGLGGGIFVKNGASLILFNSNVSGNSVTAGNNGGQARGDDIFVLGSVTQANTNLGNVYSLGSVSNFTLPIIDVFSNGNFSEASEEGSFNLRLSNTLPINLTVNYTIGGTATNGTDFNLAGSTTIPAKSIMSSINFDIDNDKIFDPNETVTVSLNPSSYYNIGTSFASSTIIDDEPNITLANTGNATESGANGTFTFNLSPTAPDDDRKLKFKVSGGTATRDAGSTQNADYRLLDARSRPETTSDFW